MPNAFPPSVQGHPIIQAKNLIQKPFNYVPAPNMGNPNYRFTNQTLGVGKVFPQPNPASPGMNFALAYYQANIDKHIQHLIDARLYIENDGTLSMTLSGVSRDSGGVALGACRVMIFRTGDMSFVMETTSDAGGNWSVNLLKGGPFFLVEYKAGSPDVAGTSVNTLAPA